MAFPTGWPPRPATGIRSLRFFAEGTATANFSDSAYLFASGTGANPYTSLPVVQPGGDTSRFPVPPATVVPNPPYGGGTVDFGAGTPMIWSFQIQIRLVSGARLEFSFDGTNIAGVLLSSDASMPIIYQRSEAGIAVRGAGCVFSIEAW